MEETFILLLIQFSLKFDGYRENALVCTGVDCDWSENDSRKTFTEFMNCPDCGSRRGDTAGRGYRENGVHCEECGLEEREICIEYRKKDLYLLVLQEHTQ